MRVCKHGIYPQMNGNLSIGIIYEHMMNWLIWIRQTHVVFHVCFSMSDVIQMLLLSRTKKIAGANPAEIVIINQPYGHMG